MKEYDIRSKKLVDNYLALVDKDIEEVFSDNTKLDEISCPGCAAYTKTHAFKKSGFNYVTCNDCDSLYVTPRPNLDFINQFYSDSRSSKYWTEVFFPQTEHARKEHIFKPRAKLIEEMIVKHGSPTPLSLVDVGSGIGSMLEVLHENGTFQELIGIEPCSGMAKVCQEKGFKVIESPIEDVSESVKCSTVVSFEVFEHLYSPLEYIKAMSNLLLPKGLMLFTTLTISGFDLQTLWDKSKTFCPPVHLNFLSIKGFEEIIKRADLELVEIFTPGKLDVDIVKNAFKENQDLELPRFFKDILNRSAEARNQKLLTEFQVFLSNHLMSSHICIVARKK